MKKLIINILMYLCILGASVSAGVLLYRQFDLHRSQSTFKRLQKEKEKRRPKPSKPISKEPTKTSSPSSSPEEIVEEEEVRELTEEEKLASIQEYLLSLKSLNEDAMAWIRIEDTPISYPVMYSPKNPEFYLYRDFDKNKASSGTPFWDARVSPELENPALIPIIYGHNMQNESMFGTLETYLQEKAYEKNPIILETMKGEKTYQVFAALRLKEYSPNSNRFYSNLNTKNKEGFESHIKFIRKNSFLSSELPVSFGDDILVLSTCSYHDPRGRLAVVAVSKK